MIPPPITQPPPMPPAKGAKVFRLMARASWLASILGVLATLSGWAISMLRGFIPFTTSLIALVIFGCGLVVGLVAIFGVFRCGKKKLLWPALIGIAANGFLVFFGATQLLFVVLKKAEQAKQAELSPAVHVDSARLLKDSQLHFNLDIPQGFHEFPEGKDSPAVVHSFIRESKDGRTAHVINIENLGVLLSRSKRLTREQFPPGFDGQIIRKKWRGMEIDVTINKEKGEGSITILHQMQIPIRPKAIRLVVGASGPEIDSDELDQLANQVLASVEGETNW